jgi:hypothetical protein
MLLDLQHRSHCRYYYPNPLNEIYDLVDIDGAPAIGVALL